MPPRAGNLNRTGTVPRTGAGQEAGGRPIAATNVIYWLQAPGSLTDQQTAFDYVVLVMEDRIGEVVGYPGYHTYDDDWNAGSFWQYTGYPGELSSGERPAFQGDGVVSSVQNESFNGQSGLVMGHFSEFTPGQSGGSIWGWWGDEPWPRPQALPRGWPALLVVTSTRPGRTCAHTARRRRIDYPYGVSSCL